MSERTKADASASNTNAQRCGVDARACGGDVEDGLDAPTPKGATDATGTACGEGVGGYRSDEGEGHGGECPTCRTFHNPAPFSGPEINGRVSRPLALPPVIVYGPDGTPRPAPFLMTLDDLTDLLRLRDSGVRFPCRTIRRYRQMGLRTVRVGRCIFVRLDDALAFLNAQQDRLAAKRCEKGVIPRAHVG